MCSLYVKRGRFFFFATSPRIPIVVPWEWGSGTAPMRIYGAGKAGQESCDLGGAECHLHTLGPETVELDQG
jgi:hypothetical protein